jgi:GT2 family glycosyltransferase/glycosyltransferase involved in cell wall biosynthesis
MGSLPRIARVSPVTPVTVIVPVYRGVDDVRRCLESVLRHASTSEVPFGILAIDDASPEPDVRAYLDALSSEAQAVPFTVVHNPHNLGFVRTVNRGIEQSSGDVVILNADTIVTERWLDRLTAAAAEPDVATVTPLTNFGSICTLPRSVIEAFALEGTDPKIDECANFVAGQSLQLLPEVITGVGFCMYVTRAALELCGHFDEDTFGLGYGEEVDFCLRASRVGLRHLVEDSTFVYHHGAGSFGDQRKQRLAEASARLHDRYRFFRAANRHERANDPLELPFVALELGLVERRADRPHVLHLLHSTPEEIGGTEKHLRVLMKSLLREFDASILYPVDHGFALRTFWNFGSDTPFEQEFLLPGAPRRVIQIHDGVADEALKMALDTFDFDAVHIHNLIGHSLAPLDALADFAGPVVCSVRDLYLACPNHSLLYRDSQPCGVPEDLALCERCLGETRDLPLSYLTDFRATMAARLESVDRWVFASQSAADYFLRVYDVPPERIEVIPHGAVIHIDRPGREIDEGLIFDEPLRLAFVGRGWPKKGLRVANELADRLAESTIEIHHFGELKAVASPRLRPHGLFDNEGLPELLHQTGIQVVLLPGPYAETFGHVMTEALIAGIPVIGASYGALGERIRSTGAGWTIDPTDIAGIQTLIENLDRCRIEVLRATRHAIAAKVDSVDGTAHSYAALYRPALPNQLRGVTAATGE